MVRTPNTKCSICEKPLYRRPWRMKKYRFFHCATCRSIFQKKHTEYWEKIANTDSGYRFKKGKQHIHIAKGKDRWNWKGGITPLRNVQRKKFTREISQIVLKRDNYTCQICKTKGGHLHVDHIQLWSEYVEMRFRIDNCRTVCRKCHYFITYGKPMPKDSKWGINSIKYAYLQ